MPAPNVGDNELLLRCACWAPFHMLSLTHDPETSQGNKVKAEGDDWYLDLVVQDRGLWERVKRAFWYVLRGSGRRMHHNFVLTNADAAALASFIVERLPREPAPAVALPAKTGTDDEGDLTVTTEVANDAPVVVPFPGGK